MGENILNPKALARDLVISLVASALPAAGGWWLGNILVGALVFVSGFFLLGFFYKNWVERLIRFVKLKNAGVAGYYYTFDLAQNKPVFDAIGKSFRYLGISGFTVVEYLKERAGREPAIEECRFLLMDPSDRGSLSRQVAFKKGVSLDRPVAGLDEALRKEIEEEVSVEVDRIKATIGALKGIDLCKKRNVLEIRLYRGFVPWWMYIVDGKRAYVGILPPGENGLNAPVVVMSRVEGFASPFAAFNNIWDKMWADASPA